VTIGLATGAAPADESSRWDLPERGLGDAYAVTKREGEERVLAMAGADVVVVNPGYMFGPYDRRPSSGRVLIELHRGAIPALTPGTNSFVDVRDVARGMMSAAERGERGERYILAGHNLSYTEAFPLFASWIGVKPPRLRLPYALCAPLGWAGDLLERLRDAEPLINSSTVGYGFCPDFRFSSKKAEAALGYTIGPLEPAVRDTMAWFRAAGMV
jgi:dihydroflavonol-4-reductase